MPGGRSVSYSDEIAERLCDEIARGRSLVSVCDEDWAPTSMTVYRWLRGERGAPSTFGDRYARAREMQAERFADEVVSIADDMDDDAQSRRVRVDARKWAAGKLMPKKYGDRASLDIGGQPGNPVQTQQTTVDVTSTLTDDERREFARLAQAALQRGAGK